MNSGIPTTLPVSEVAELRIPYNQLRDFLAAILIKIGFTPDRARECASMFADVSLDAVHSHGINRFPRFVRAVRNGVVNPNAMPELVSRFGALERWDGHRGVGNLNARHAMDRAMALGQEHGIGCVALANTNHWMRGGAYGWQAADAGLIGMCWTNTMPNVPPWGSAEPRIGNNPLIVAIPRKQGHLVLDIAMSQFSYGALEAYRLRGEMLPVPGGFNRKGELTCDPAEIEKSSRHLTIGYWKGSGLAIMLDLLGAVLSGGLATHQIPGDSERETSLSQVFLTIDPTCLSPAEEVDEAANQLVDNLHGASPLPGTSVRYPGEQVLKTRKENMERGIPVNPAIWKQIQQL
jgi:3-dehydro-L-gulonate 2-dehydrogenase